MNTRQADFLKKIVELYIETGIPVGSKHFIEVYQLKISSATVRNEMALLERDGYLEKSHTSSGRIPSVVGYEYYAHKLANSYSQDLAQKLSDVFAKRQASIDFTLEEAAKVITNIAKFTLVTSNSEGDEVMKSIQLTPISKSRATIVIVTSSGQVLSKMIELNELINIEDVRIAVRLFKERLIDTKLKDLAIKVASLGNILSQSIKNYEMLIQQFVQRIFDFHRRIRNNVYGNRNIVKSDIKREDLAKLLDMIETKSIFASIEKEVDEDDNIKIDVRPNNTSLLSTQIAHDSVVTEVSVVGPNRMDYAEAKQAIALLKQFLKGKS